MANFNKRLDDTTIRIGEVRFSYAHVFEPKAGLNGGDPKFSCSIIIPKSNKQAVDMINDCISAAAKAKWGDKIPRNLRNPLRDGDTDREDDAYADSWFINCSATTKFPPAVKVLDNGNLVDALDNTDFYSGCYGAAVLRFFAYEAQGNKGIGAGMNALVKTRDGENLSGGVSVDDALADLV